MNYPILPSTPYFNTDGPISHVEVIKRFKEAVTAHPEDEIVLALKVLPCMAFVPDELDLITTYCERILREYPDPAAHMYAKYYRAFALYFSKTNPEEAERLLLQFVSDHPNASFDLAIFDLIELYTEKKNEEQARHWAQRYIDLNPLDPSDGYLRMGDMLCEFQKWEEALSWYEKIEPDPDFDNYDPPRKYEGIGLCYAHMEKFPEALSAFEKAWEAWGEHKTGYVAYLIGRTLQSMDNPYMAMHWYTKAIEINPRQAEAYNNLAAITFEEGGSFKDALPFLLQAEEANNGEVGPWMKDIYRNLMVYYENILDHEKEAEYKRKMFECLGLGDLFDFAQDDTDDTDDDDDWPVS